MGCGAGTLKGVSQPGDESNPLTTVIPDSGGGSSSSHGNGKKSKIVPAPEEPSSSTAGKKDGGPSRSAKQTSRIPRRVSNRQSVSNGSDHTNASTAASMGGGDEDYGNGPTEEERRLLNKVFQKHFLFCSLDENERQVMIEHMERRITKNSETIFKQGDKGDKFFVIVQGTFSVSIDDRALKQLRQKQTFGELALLYKVRRTATVACVQSGVLWALGEKRFRECLKNLNNQQRSRVKGFLELDPSFSSLALQDRDKLAEACTMQVFQKGEQILREGEVGDWMFIIMEGNVQVVDQKGDTALRHPGTILGAVGIMCTKRQLYGAKAIDPATCLALGRASLDGLPASVADLLRRSAIRTLLLGSSGFSGAREGDMEFFGKLFYAQQDLMIDKFEEASFQEGDAVLPAGSDGHFLVVMEGEVAVVGEAMVAQAGCSSLHLKEYAREVLGPGTTYGGRAVLDSSAARTKESVFALSQVRLHRISREVLADALGGPVAEVLRWNEIKKVLSDVFLFKNLAEDQIDKTIRSLTRRRYAAGEVVVKQGDVAKHFFLIQSGTIKVVKDGLKLRTLGRWDYFGERGLLMQERRSATCESEGGCTCLVLEADTFSDIVGNFRRDLEHRMYLQDLDITMKDLELRAVVGRGTFGIVKLVNHHKDVSKVYALKCVEKRQVVDQHQEKAITIERDIHAQCYHPCVVQFIKTFQDKHHIYFLTEFLGGGDLFYVIREIGSLSKEQAQFYSGSIVLALEYLHGRSIMYRDLKPENVLLDFEGNAKLVDFGCCKKALRASTLVGTPEYLAPEVIIGKGYTAAIDWWALGVMLHEFVVGPLPFGKDTEDQLELFREILEAPLQFPSYVGDESATSIVAGLLERAPELRVGSGAKGAKEIQEHRYYSSFDWRALLGHYMTPPWVPDAERIKSNWEMMSGQRLTGKDSEPIDPSKLEKSMEWAAVF